MTASDRTDANTVAELEYDGGEYPFRKEPVDRDDYDWHAEMIKLSVIDGLSQISPETAEQLKQERINKNAALEAQLDLLYKRLARM